MKVKTLNGNINIVPTFRESIFHMDKTVSVIDKNIYRDHWDPIEKILYIIDDDKKEVVKYTNIKPMNALDDTNGQETFLWNSSDNNGNIDGTKIMFSKNVYNGPVDIKVKKEDGTWTNVSSLDIRMYDTMSEINKDGSITLTVENRNSGKTYKVNNVKDEDSYVMESILGKESSDNPIGKIERTSYAHKNLFAVSDDNGMNYKTYQLGKYDSDGGNSWVNHDYSIYAEVTKSDGSVVKCYSEKDYNKAVNNSTKFNVVIKKETHKWIGKNPIEILDTLDNTIDIYRKSQAMTTYNNQKKLKATHSKVD